MRGLSVKGRDLVHFVYVSHFEDARRGGHDRLHDNQNTPFDGGDDSAPAPEKPQPAA